MNTKLLRNAVCLSCLAATLVGCQSFRAPWKKKAPEGPQAIVETDDVRQPEKVVALWSDSTFTQPGKPATRGVGGRFYFYDGHRETVPVAGQLVIYGYDDSTCGTSERKPERKYVFTPQQFAGHYSESAFGPSYSFWVPWDPAGGETKQISLVPVFTTTDGHVVVGDHARHVLPGTPTANPLEPADAPSDRPATPLVENDPLGAGFRPQVALTSYQPHDNSAETVAGQPIATPVSDSTIDARLQTELRSTSIRLPPTVQRRLISSTPSKTAGNRRHARDQRAAVDTGQSSYDALVPALVPNPGSGENAATRDSMESARPGTPDAEAKDVDAHALNAGGSSNVAESPNLTGTPNVTGTPRWAGAPRLTGLQVPRRPSTRSGLPKLQVPSEPVAPSAISAPRWPRSPATQRSYPLSAPELTTAGSTNSL